jgi:hypothetical protein
MNKLIPPSSQSNLRVFTSCLLSFLLFMTPLATLAASIKPTLSPVESESARQSSYPGFFNRLGQAVAPPTTAQPANSARRGFFSSLMPAVPVVTATKVDSFLVSGDDADSDGKADPGDKITYTVTISNAVADATGVVFNDTVHAHTTYVTNSLNVSPLASNDSYDTIGNTLLEVGPVTSPSSRPKVTVTGDVFDNDTEFMSDTFTLKSLQAVNFVSGTVTATSTNGGTIVMDGDGKFSFTPKEGSTAADTFTYTITDAGADNVAGNADDLTSTATVTINITAPKIWYVDNTAAAGGKGRSTDPFDTLVEAESASAAGDYIYVFTGSGTTGQNAGITLKANQLLIGEGVQLDVPVSVNGGSNPTVLRSAGTKPQVTNTAGNSVTVTNISGVSIRGFNFVNGGAGHTNAIAATFSAAGGGVTISDNTITGGTGNAIDVTTTTTTPGGCTATITNNTISGAGSEGIDINGQGSGGITLNMQTNAVTSTGNGIDINGLGGGTLNITGFANNSVSGASGANGILINTARFDATPGGGFDPITAGTTAIGATGAGNGVGGNGLVLINTTGTLPFTDLDIFADNGAGLDVTGTGSANSGITVGSGVGVIEATNGPAVKVGSATIDLQLTSIKSTNSGTTGIELASTVGPFSAGSGSSITNATGNDIDLNGGSGNFTYSANISNSSARSISVSGRTSGTVSFSGTVNDTGTGISLTSNTGTTINFTNTLTLSTGNNAAFTATGGGTISSTAAASTITTGAATALNVTNTQIGSGGLTFTSISVNGATKGIILNSTGTAAGNGSLSVTGTGTTVGSGGTIQNISQRGGEFISTKNLSLKNMNFTNANTSDAGGAGVCDDSNTTNCNAAIYLSSVSTVTLDNLDITGTIAEQGINGRDVSNFTLKDSLIGGSLASMCGNAVEEGCVKMRNLTGTSAITNSELAFAGEDVVEIYNPAGGTLLLNVDNSTFRDTQSAANGGCGIIARNDAGTMTVNVNNSNFNRIRTTGLKTVANLTATADVDVTGNTFDPGAAPGVGIGIDLDADNTATLRFNIQANTKIYSRNGPAVNIFGDNSANINGRINNNSDIRVLSNPGGSQVGSGVRVNLNKNATGKIEIKSNTINIASDDAGIDVSGIGKTTANPGGATNTLDNTITGNNITIGATSTYGILIIAASNAGDTNAMCSNVANNAVTRNPTSIASFRFRVASANGFNRLEGFTVDPEATWNAKGNTPVSAGGSEVSFGGSGTIGSCTAALPTNPALSPSTWYKPETSNERGIYLASTDSDSQSAGQANVAPSRIWSRFSASSDEAFTSHSQAATNHSNNETPKATQPASQNIPGLQLLKSAKKRLAVNSIAKQTTSSSSAFSNHGSKARTQPVAKARAAAATLMPSGESVPTATIGTLKAGQSVTITFQVTLDTPPNLDAADLVGGPHVRNQGTVSGSNFTLVNGVSTSQPNTDDTALGGASDPTDTPVDLYNVDVSVSTSKPGPTWMLEGESVTFTATVTPTAGQPVGVPSAATGTVTFYDGAAVSGNEISGCVGVALSGTTAQCTTTALTSAGSPHTITAQYNGDGNFDTNTGTVSQTVNPCTNNPVVTSVADSGAGSLREAIATACVGSTITFDTAGVFSTPQTITLTSGELVVSKNLTIDGPDATANRVTISGNNSSRAFNISSGFTVNISELTISNGSGTGSGGGGIINSGTLYLKGVTVSSNSANMGGGIRNASTGTLYVINSTVSNNSTTAGAGGGIYNTGTLFVRESTISTNTANGSGGGGIWNSNTFIATVYASTIANNVSQFAGGGINQAGIQLNISNTIVADNDSLNTSAEDLSGTYNSQDYNIFENPATAIINGTTTNNQTGDPKLGPLTNNGGPTQTHALLLGSIALDAGSDLALTTLNGAITAVQTSIVVTDASSIPAGVGYTILIDSEQVVVTAKSGNTLTVTRGANGTTAAAHSNGANIYPAFDQRGTGFTRKVDSADSGTTQTVDVGAFETQPTIGDIPDKADGLEDVSIASYPFDVGDATIGIDSISTSVTSDPSGVVQSVTVNNATTATPNLSIAYVANKFGTATISVTVNKTINGQLLTMSDSFVLTVLPVADVPSVTNATTNEDTQTTSGLVISRNAADGAEVTHFKITNITNGTLFKNDGVTQINNNDFITFAEGNAGLKFTPAANSLANGSFQVQAATDGTGSGLSTAATATITVNAIADTPSVTNATTNEDTQSTTGLVISRNANDGAEVTHFKITGITNGTLFQNDGTTQINNNDFITFAQGNAGLKFTPTANFHGNGQFTIQASTTNANGGLGGSTIVATITVVPIADTPSVTNATTTEDTQTTSGLVISRNAVDGTEVSHFKITNIQNGTLYKNDGVTVINNNDFITFAEGNAGLKFTPAPNFSGAGIFQVQGATSAAGAGLSAGFATATITVGSTADVPSVTDATTDEDVQTSSGLVITRNANDGVEVTHFKITSITGGTLFKNDGTTQITNNTFITAAEGNAGLKFTPTANSSANGSFQVQAALDASGTGLSVAATATITVNPIADTPSVTNATTAINTQTTSGLVISRNAVDGAEVTHFKITNITNGTLYKNDGTTVINNNDFITFAEGNAGLKFTPDLNKSTSNGDVFSFQVQGATDNTGLSAGFATASITVDCQSGLVVTSLLDDGSVGTLRHAINFACPGSTITFNLAAGTHTITLDSSLGQLVINKNLTINGPTGAANRVTVSGNNSTRVLQITGAVTVNISDLTISNGQVSGGSGIGGSGIFNNGGTLTLTNSTISSNTSAGLEGGGGIYTLNGTLNVTNSTVSGNSTSAGPGGGIRIGGGGSTLTVTNSTISGNSATGLGGGIAVASTTTITNSTISGNSATGEGGGLRAFGGPVNIVNSTITNNICDSDNNSSGTGGGIRNLAGGALTLHNTIVAGNGRGSAVPTADDIQGSVNAASSFNLIGNAATAGDLTHGTNSNIVGNSGAGTIDARLGALASNGGSTQTHALLAGSPALDAGSNTVADNNSLTTDQRGTGYDRKRDAASDADTTQTVDIGAFEADPSVEDIADKATAEDTALPAFVFRVGDSASAFTSITATSSNTTLVPNANITVGSDTPSTRTLSITPAANQSGTTTITVTVTKTINSTVISMSDTFVLTVGTVPDTPSVTNATTNEDTQTTSGLVISRNAADGAEVTHFKITNITNGTLFKNDGVTQINNNDFITFAEGNAGLKFTPAANSLANGSFQVQAATDAVGTSLSAGAATATITINPVADTPSVTNATTNEDTQTTSGLVVSRNAADGAEVTHFKITGITGGTLFKTDDTTQINNNDVITFAEGNAGLKFTPAANLFSPSSTFSFQVQGATSAAGAGLSAGAATATITVNTVADTPSVTNATTNEDAQTTSGLVITRNAADGAEVTHFKITGITGGTLFQNNGTTAINNNDFITVAQGNAGLKFTPTANSNTNGSFQVQSSLNNTNAGLGGNLATATITINPINDAPTLDAIGNLNINEDAGAQVVNLTGISAGGGESQTLVVTATSDNTGVVPNPTVNYTSPNATGSLSFTPVPNQSGSAIITVTVNDGGGTANGGVETVTRTFTVTVNAVNDAPENTVPSAQNVIKNSTLTFNAANSNLISISDVDAGGNSVQVTLTATNGRMTLSGTAGLTFVPANGNNDGNNDASLNFTGTIANINNALNGMVFAPTNGYDGPASIQITTNDLGNSGSGGALSDTDTINITVLKGGVLDFSSATYTVAEDGGSVTITVNRTDGSNGTVKVDYTTSDGTAVAGEDYTTSSGELTFNNGVTTQTFTVPITNDSLDEANETVNLTLSNAQGSGALGTQTTAVLTITDNDPTPSLSINDVSLAEGNSGTTNFTFTVTLSAASGQTVTVNYQTNNGSATTANNDYQAIPSTLLTFNPGETSKNVTVQVNGDPDAEIDETFTVDLSGATNATLADSQGLGTILSDDTPVMQLDAPTYTVNEDALFVKLTVNRIGDTAQPATINYTTNDQAGLTNCNVFNGIASPRCDYALTVGKLRFAAGEASRDILIPIINDVYVEGSETFTFTLSNPTGGAELGTPSSATITILDNDNGPAPNPIDNNEFLIREFYVDFLGRLPDQGGLAAWLDILNDCPVGDTTCDRIAVARGFTHSEEFGSRGYFIYRAYRATLGRIPHYAEFMPDVASVSGFMSAQDLDAAKNEFINDFMSRPEFHAKYDSTINDPTAYVNLLEQTALVPLPNKQALINDLANNTKTRAQVLRIVMETVEVYAKYFNEAFIVMNYFGFLRRNPDAAFQVWIDLFNHTNDYRLIINGFINSNEYKQRFGP